MNNWCIDLYKIYVIYRIIIFIKNNLNAIIINNWFI